MLLLVVWFILLRLVFGGLVDCVMILVCLLGVLFGGCWLLHTYYLLVVFWILVIIMWFVVVFVLY